MLSTRDLLIRDPRMGWADSRVPGPRVIERTPHGGRLVLCAAVGIWILGSCWLLRALGAVPAFRLKGWALVGSGAWRRCAQRAGDSRTSEPSDMKFEARERRRLAEKSVSITDPGKG